MVPTVLIVDDDAEVVRTFAEWLRLEGYHVRTAADGQHALQHLRGTDAVILDVRMPILDGLAFLRKVREQESRVPVAIVTGDYLIEDSLLKEFERLDAQVRFKPLWVDELVTLATAMVEGKVGV